MADAWGGSFGSSWGNSWGGGGIPPIVPTDRGGDGFPGGGIRRRRKYRKITRDQLEKLFASKEETPPAPTKKRIKAVQRRIVEEITEGLGAPERQAVATFVRREVVQAYQPGIDWAALAVAFEHLMRQAAEEAERVEQEIEDEDEMILMMAV